MTTKFLNNKMFTFKILLSWRFPRKQAFLDDFPLCPQGPPPPLESANFIFIVVSLSLIFISRDTSSVSQNSFVLVLVGGIAQSSRDTLQNGVSHRCACVNLSAKGGYRTFLGEC